MENSKTYQFIPYPEEDIEIAFNLMAEMRADMWYWQKKEWYLKQKIKENVSNDFLFKFYTDLLTRVEKIVNKVYTAQSDTRFDITKYTTTKHEDEIFEKIIKLADKIIEANPRKNKSLEIVNQPYPLPFKINYQ
tara:strand:+ start:181 stop:582 length:402 start_codon:yes stop_codon:yes gene_type:complete